MTSHFRILLTIVSFCLLSCGKNQVQPEYGAIPISTTIPALADLVRQVGGVRVKVYHLIPADSDPAAFQDNAEAQALLASTKLFFHGATDIEQSMIAAAEKIPNLQRLQVGSEIAKDRRIVDPQSNSEVPACYWGDASLWEKCIQDVFNALVKIDPESREVLEQNVTYYREKLLVVHEWALRRAQEIPPGRRLIITNRDNLRYFAKAYGFETVAVRTEEDVRKAVEAIRDRGVRTVFNEVGVAPGKIQEVADLSGAALNSKLYGYGPSRSRNTESYQAETYDTSNYVGMLKHNINTLVQGLR